MMETLCGLCGANGLKKQLILFQLNLEEAILLCENKECVYPLGITDNSKLIVQRQASEMTTLSRRKRKKKQKQKESEVQKIGIKETRFLESYLHWQNVDALCWLHSLLSLVVHNLTLVTSALSLADDVGSLLRIVIESFSKAQDLCSANREQAMKGLHEARGKVWRYLQPLIKCQYGVKDSPVTALPLLLRENGTLSEKTLQVFQWEFSCNACGYQQTDKRSKHLVTFPNVAEGFSLQDPEFTRSCFRCGAPNQKSKLVYNKMPECVLLHFEQGLQSFQDLSFKGQNGLYIITQFVQYKQRPDHFVCWTKEPKGKRWMEVDDLKSPLCSWRSSFPNIPPSEVHIAVWEKVSSDLESQLSPLLNDADKMDTKQKPIDNIKVNCSAAKVSSRPLSDVNCNVTVASTVDANKPLLSPTSSTPLSLHPVILRSSQALHNVQHKLQAGKFEPYIPRKKRLISYICPNSPVCTKPDPSTTLLIPSSPSPSQPFLTWQDIKEQTQKCSADDLQSDSGYSSPPSVSSCSSLLASQSSISTLVSDCLEDLHVFNGNEKLDVDEKITNAVRDNFACGNDELTPTVFSSCKGTSGLFQGERQPAVSSHSSCQSVELANKLEELLPDCLLDSSKDLTHGNSAIKLADFEKLSDEQDQFIRGLLAV